MGESFIGINIIFYIHVGSALRDFYFMFLQPSEIFFFMLRWLLFFVTAGWMADVEGACAFHLANLYGAQYIYCESLDITFNVRQHFYLFLF